MKKVLVAAAFVLSASVSNAIYIEPYLGVYGTGKSTSGGTDTNLKATIGYGLRLGYSIPMIAFGVDYGMGNVDIETTPTTKSKSTDLGIFGSFNIPVLPVRAYLTYILDAKLTPDGGSDYKGKGTKIGVSFTGLPMVFINLDYYMIKYDTYGGASADLDVKMTALSVSLPLNF
ncbi:MAG: hypothetical protein A4S09_08350 [Proteobacteria bacterium SG_bin7]|nr:MAG: hypothetical protein A4S09_08350 [Proteobacteria bacterium SG_bin7]